MECYLDNGATTRCLEEVAEVVQKTMLEDYGNPSSKHQKGVDAEQYVKASREIIAKSLKVPEKDIYFTSGGTESNNWALIGTALANKRAGNHIITTAVEHAAVLQPLQFLAEMGFRVTYIPVDSTGKIKLEALKEALCEDTILVSIMYVNNELGVLEPVEEAAKLVKAYRPEIVFHVDAIQAYGKFPIYPKRVGIDLLSASGHKIHGPKGVGFLYANSNIKIKPYIWGGGQQRGMRSGTDNVPGVAGLGAAARAATEQMEAAKTKVAKVRDCLERGVRELPGTVINSVPDGSPYILSVSFEGVRSEVLLHALEEKQIYVSSGSACSSNKKLPVSSVLQEIGLAPNLLESTIRFSFSRFTTEEEIVQCLDVLKELLPMLRKYSRH